MAVRARVLIWGKNGERVRAALGFIQAFYMALWSTPRHTSEEGEAASDMAKGSTASCWPPREKKMRTSSSFLFFCRRGTWAGVGLCWPGVGGLLLDLPCWAAAAGKVQVSLLPLFLLFIF
jgi:hypothetical protein